MSDSKVHQLPCLICGVIKDPVLGCSDQNHPENASCFQTEGKYGSQVFDPGDGSEIEITLCDNCLKRAIRQQRVYFYTKDDENHLHPTYFKGIE